METLSLWAGTTQVTSTQWVYEQNIKKSNYSSPPPAYLALVYSHSLQISHNGLNQPPSAEADKKQQPEPSGWSHSVHLHLPFPELTPTDSVSACSHCLHLQILTESYIQCSNQKLQSWDSVRELQPRAPPTATASYCRRCLHLQILAESHILQAAGIFYLHLHEATATASL